MSFSLHLGDCLETLRGLPENSVDPIVTDPPYGLSFMGKLWDYDVPSIDVWAECLRVLKPGGHLLAFAGTRTQHRMAVRIEDAGFEIRDMIAWVYGSGFPKSLDVSKAIDKAAGVEREKVRKPCAATAYSSNAGNMRPWMERAQELGYTEVDGSEPATDAARQWQGWGTALKPALEPITVARKPLAGTVAENVLAHGTGALNIDGCRVETTDDCARKPALVDDTAAGFGKGLKMGGRGHDAGRWPANLIHDGSDEVLAEFPDSNGSWPARTLNRSAKPDQRGWGMNTAGADVAELRDAGSGSAARFFYCAKANKRDRDEGLEGLPLHAPDHGKGNTAGGLQVSNSKHPRANIHPTVKPTDLMRYLCRLVTPPGGVVLDPFMGSGSTGKAAVQEGFRFIGCELSPEYLAIANARIAHALYGDLA